MDITQLLSFINVVILGICLCVGYAIKHWIPSDKVNKYIPTIMAVLGVVLAIWSYGTFTPDILLIGLISGLASTGLYEAFRNLIEKEG
ncbi:MAG: phage holin family protein [Butyrivibrio sp.]|nr:phage holin family protein [Butyrivibrio sp.]